MFSAVLHAIRSPSVALSGSDRDAFSALAQARNSYVEQITAIEAAITQQADMRGHDKSSRALWRDALRAGRAPEIDALAQAGQSQQEALQAFAQERGFSSAERMAKVCGLPSPSPVRRV